MIGTKKCIHVYNCYCVIRPGFFLLLTACCLFSCVFTVRKDFFSFQGVPTLTSSFWSFTGCFLSGSLRFRLLLFFYWISVGDAVEISQQLLQVGKFHKTCTKYKNCRLSMNLKSWWSLEGEILLIGFYIYVNVSVLKQLLIQFSLFT